MLRMKDEIFFNMEFSCVTLRCSTLAEFAIGRVRVRVLVRVIIKVHVKAAVHSLRSGKELGRGAWWFRFVGEEVVVRDIIRGRGGGGVAP